MSALRALAERLVSFDDPDNPAGLEDRRSVTLTALIEQARSALAEPVQQDAQKVIVEAMTSRYEELTGESISHDNDGARQILRALGDAGLKIVPADQPEQPDDLPEIWWKPEDERGDSCLSVRMIGGQKAYRRHWNFGTSREFIEWGWVVADTAVRLAT